MSNKFLIVGLGNFAAPYKFTRHNVGHMFLDDFCERLGMAFQSGADGSSIASFNLQWALEALAPAWKVPKTVAPADIAASEVVLLKNSTLMNVCGSQIVKAARRSNVQPARLLVAHDNLETAFGKVSIKARGSANGHNGVRSIQDNLRSQDFPRVRIGIGRPPDGVDVSSFVLGNFSAWEKERIKEEVSPLALSKALEECVQRLAVAESVKESR